MEAKENPQRLVDKANFSKHKLKTNTYTDVSNK